MKAFHYIIPILMVSLLASCVNLIPDGGAGDGWKPMLERNSLGKWKETDFAGHGDISVKNGVLTIQTGIELSGVNWTGEYPKVDYEIAFDARRAEGNDFFCGLTFPVNKTHATLILGGWGGALVGISSLDGLDAAENDTGDVYVFEDGRWYSIKLRVQEKRIRVWINDKEQIDADTTDRKVGMRIGEIEMSMPLGIATWMTTGEIRKLRIREFKEAAAK